MVILAYCIALLLQKCLQGNITNFTQTSWKNKPKNKIANKSMSVNKKQTAYCSCLHGVSTSHVWQQECLISHRYASTMETVQCFPKQKLSLRETPAKWTPSCRLTRTVPPAPYEHSRRAPPWPCSRWPLETSRTSALHTVSSAQIYPKRETGSDSKTL